MQRLPGSGRLLPICIVRAFSAHLVILASAPERGITGARSGDISRAPSQGWRRGLLDNLGVAVLNISESGRV